MALPARLTLAEHLANARQSWRNIKSLSGSYIARLSQPTVNSGTIVEILERMKRERAALAVIAGTPGIVDYVRSEYADEALDVVADFQAMSAALDACIAWVIANIPKDANGFLLKEQIDAQGVITQRMFTAAQVSGLVTRLQTLAATID